MFLVKSIASLITTDVLPFPWVESLNPVHGRDKQVKCLSRQWIPQKNLMYSSKVHCNKTISNYGRNHLLVFIFLVAVVLIDLLNMALGGEACIRAKWHTGHEDTVTPMTSIYM